MRSSTSIVALGLLLPLLLAGGCSSSVGDLVSPTSDFWDRSPCVAGARQAAPCEAPPAYVARAPAADCGCPAPAQESFPAPQPYRASPPLADLRAESYAPPPRAEPAPEPEPDAAPACGVPAPRPAPRAVAAPEPARPSPVHAPASVEEMRTLDEVNRVRAQHSLRALRYEPHLWRAARDHSAEQQAYRYMGHGSPDPERRELVQRMAQADYRGRVYAEVVAWGYPDVASVVQGWMNSADHRRILLDPELTEGAFSRVGDYWTGNFGAPARWGAVSAPRPTASAAPRRGVGPATTVRPTSAADASGFRRAPTPGASAFRRAPAPAPAPAAVRRAPQPVPVDPRPRPAPQPAPAKSLPLQPAGGFG